MISCRVAVVGGGLAGLAAAELLLKRNVDVRLFQESDRIGGRVFTARNEKGQHFEVGAFSFTESDKTLIDYVNRFRLEAIRHNEIATVTRQGLSEMTAQCRSNLAVGYTELVEITSDQNESQQTQIQASNGYLTLSLLRTVLPPIPGAINSIALNTFGKRGFSLKGGNDRLPGALANELKERLHYNFHINSLERHGNGYLLDGRVRADKVILAIPMAALGKMAIKPALSPGKIKALSAFTYTLCQRVTYLLNGDLEHNSTEPGAKRTDMNKQGYYLYVWDQVPYLLGGDSCYPSEALHLHKAAAAPEGGIYFAGEHTSENFARMNGALESGIRAGNEVLASLN